MKTFRVALLALFLPLTATGQDLGLGVVLGWPSGFTAKKLVGENAVDAVAAWGLNGGDFQIHGDWLWQFQDALYFQETQPLDLHLGLGARMKFVDEVELGVRLPVGLSAWFSERRLETFAEIAPIIDFVPGTQWEGQVMVGVRLYAL